MAHWTICQNNTSSVTANIFTFLMRSIEAQQLVHQAIRLNMRIMAPDFASRCGLGEQSDIRAAVVGHRQPGQDAPGAVGACNYLLLAEGQCVRRAGMLWALNFQRRYARYEGGFIKHN